MTPYEIGWAIIGLQFCLLAATIVVIIMPAYKKWQKNRNDIL